MEKFADVNPARIGLNGKAGEPVKAQVRITGTSKFPFKIVNVKASTGQNIRFHLEEIKDSKIPQYILMVENTMSQKGRYVDNISLETDSRSWGIYSDLRRYIMSEKVLSITEEDFMRMKAIIMDQDRDEAFHLIKEFVKRLEIQQHKGMKSHLDSR